MLSQPIDFTQKVWFTNKMEDLPPWAKGFKPRQNPQKPIPAVVEPVIEVYKLNQLEQMPRNQLISLVQRMYAMCGYLPSMTDEQTAQAMLDSLASIALKPIGVSTNMRADIQSRLTAIEKWLDRTQGKPAQSLAVTQTNVHLTAAQALGLDQGVYDNILIKHLRKRGALPAPQDVVVETEPQSGIVTDQ